MLRAERSGTATSHDPDVSKADRVAVVLEEDRTGFGAFGQRRRGRPVIQLLVLIISFLIGMIQGDVEEIRLAWGVKSLPWLILTDPKHIVRAEGFNAAELDTRIQRINEKQ